MGVKEELEALRNQGVTKKNASKLQGASGLSTPEAEEQAIKKEHERIRIGNYKKDSVKNLQSYNEAKIAVTKAGDGSILPIPAQRLSISKPDAKAKSTTVTPSPAKATTVTPSPAKATTATPSPAKATTATPSPAKATTATPSPAKAAETPAPQTPAPAPAPAVETAADDDVPTLEELPDMEEVPALEEMPALDVSGEAAAAVAPSAVVAPPAPINRAERKARRMMEKLGMKAVPGISQVVLKMRGGGVRGGIFTIVGPDVFEKGGSFVVFGEARQGGGGNPAAQQAQQQAQAIQQLAALAQNNSEGSGIELPASAAAGGDEAAKAEDAVDESGLDAGNIDLCVTQAGCSRAKAVKALRDNDGDLVNAIMSLTT